METSHALLAKFKQKSKKIETNDLHDSLIFQIRILQVDCSALKGFRVQILGDVIIGDSQEGMISEELRQPLGPSSDAPSSAQKQRLKRLEGESTIREWLLLRVNWGPAIAWAIVMTVSLVGLLMLKYYKSLRVRLFYQQLSWEQKDQATHVYVKSNDKLEQIPSLIHRHDGIYFYFRHLKIQLIDNDCLPVGLHYLDQINYYLNPEYLRTGLSSQQVAQREEFYGRNEHKVQVPNYFEYLFDVMTKPFFILQYISSAIWILESLTIFGVVLLIISALTTTVNYILLYFSYRKIKQKVERQFPVKALRDGRIIEINNTALVPGDLFYPSKQIPCDAIVVKGELFVDEASLTGENVPIAKKSLADQRQVLDSSHWVFEGSQLETMKEDTLAVSIQVGFGSRRGRIIRTIMTKVPKQPAFFIKLLIFLGQVLIVGIILFLISLPILLGQSIEPIMIFFRFLDFITYCLPATFPIFFQTAYSACLIRLSGKGISGTESQKTVESSRMRTLCFDKTGTLTRPQMQVTDIFIVTDSNTVNKIQSLTQNQIAREIFAACHSVEEIQGTLKGDEIDLKMLEASGATMRASKDKGVVREVMVGCQKLQILRINAYQSKFQSMSVLYTRSSDKKVFLAVKGSPQKIHQHSNLKYRQYSNFIRKLSLGGLRSIAFGVRQVGASDVTRLLQSDREEYLRSTRIVGVVTFINELKHDAVETISTLRQAKISTKMITGDNIFLGVKTAIMAGIIPKNCKVMAFEGGGKQAAVTELTFKEQHVEERCFKMSKFQFKNQNEIVYAVDNAFLESNQDFLHPKISVFARISPENKAKIVREHIRIERQSRRGQNWWQRALGESQLKVGMVGDGANDLIAIKEAHVGIGISESDAVYSATFAITELSQIPTIILEAKNIERQIIETGQYYGMVNYLSLLSMVLLSNDASFFTSMQFIYRNFFLVILMTGFIGVSRPAQKMNPHLPASNFMGLEHHLVFWGNALILSGGVALGYYTFFSSSYFLPNPQPTVTFKSGWNGECMSTTTVMLLTSIISLIIPLFIYRSSPWKEPFYKNLFFSGHFIINGTLIILGVAFMSKLTWLDIVALPAKWIGLQLLIIGVTLVICALFNKFIEKKALHERQTPVNTGDQSPPYDYLL